MKLYHTGTIYRDTEQVDSSIYLLIFIEHLQGNCSEALPAPAGSVKEDSKPRDKT